MIISDLNLLENVEATDVVGGSGYKFKKDIDVNIKYRSDVRSKVDLKGNVAEATADATAYGKNTFTSGETFTYVDQGKVSASSSYSLSATDGAKFRRY